MAHTQEVRKWIFLRTDRILTENGKMDRLYYTENVFAIPSLSQYILTCKFDESRKRLDFLISSSLSMFVIIFTTRLVDSKGLQAKQRFILVVKDISLLPMLGPYRACLVEAVTRWSSGLSWQFLAEKKSEEKSEFFSGDFTKKLKIQKKC